MERFERSGLTFDVRDCGPADGEPVVLLHGFPQDGTAWSGVVPLLHAAGLRTLVPDQRGYSPGARPRSRREYTLGHAVDDVLALLDAADLTAAHVVGHDWGGAVAWVLAGRHPVRVKSLTVVSTPHPAAMIRSMTRSTQGLRSWYMLAFQLPWLPELLMPGRMFDGLRRSGLPAAHAEHYAQMMQRPGALGHALNWYRAMPFAAGQKAPRSRVPTTYVWGNKDFALGRAAAEWTADFALADYRFVELDAGHWLPERRPEQVAAAIVERVSSTS
ncbi:alpha/beta fold hydrolase [Spongisporangium articulatum]|uniref:Alpha/beta fold hydrolase n=1 Tax=Spongisporangium articulatum TaxID=3362603 RepID=A0ABW8ASH3_9ACTN